MISLALSNWALVWSANYLAIKMLLNQIYK